MCNGGNVDVETGTTIHVLFIALLWVSVSYGIDVGRYLMRHKMILQGKSKEIFGFVINDVEKLKN